jgi:uncharacterized protein (TIGR00645 family)
MKKIELIFERIIFASRWVQAPVYFGLIIASILYAFKFAIELSHLVMKINSVGEELVMLCILTLVDIVMVLNLLTMVIIGGYVTFVSKINLYTHEDKPDWLEKINAGSLKVKLAGALVSISGIHLLKTFINIENKQIELVKWQITIHIVFLLSTLALAISEHIFYRSQKK